MTSTQQFLILLLIVAVFAILISHMVHYTWSYNYTSLKITDCSDMYNNLTVMDLCYSKFRWEIDP